MRQSLPLSLRRVRTIRAIRDGRLIQIQSASIMETGQIKQVRAIRAEIE